MIAPLIFSLRNSKIHPIPMIQHKISLEKNFLQKFFGDKSKSEIEAELQNIITNYFSKGV